MKPVIGIDFDNTIVSYDRVFHTVALERGLIPADFAANKEKIRNYLRALRQEDAWTEMQGYVYGKRMEIAQAFSGVREFVKEALARDLEVYIISHKTKYPYAGPQYDLHAAAYAWLEAQDFFGLAPTQISFLETKRAKCEKIAAQHCSHFIDDLPELLLDEAFPAKVAKLLFSPEAQEFSSQADVGALLRFRSWHEINDHFFNVALS